MKPTFILNLFVLLAINGCITKGQETTKEATMAAVSNTAGSSTETNTGEKDRMLSAPSTASIIDALKEMGIHIYNINLPKIPLDKYELVIYRDTYLGGVKTSHPTYPRTMELRNTTYSKNHKAALVLTLLNKNDSLFVDSWQLPTGARYTTTSRKNKEHFLDFNVTPFKSQEIVPGKKIPLLVYGSSWIDEKTGYRRYCMDLELDPDFSHEAFKRMPGYHVYSIELKKK